MSIHGVCHDNGTSGRCNIWDCGKFSDGHCGQPEEIISYEENITQLEMEEIFVLYPVLMEYNILNKKEDTAMNQSEFETSLNVQKKDRVDASVSLMRAVDKLTKTKPQDQVFFMGTVDERFSETIHVPIKVVCYESNGERRVYLNAMRVGSTILSVSASKELIECFDRLKKEIERVDVELGCEHLNELVSETL